MSEDNGKHKERELITLDDGREAYKYPSGLIKDAVTGYIVKPAQATLLTTQRASQLTKQRWDDFREKAQQKTVERFQERGLAVAGASDAWGEIISKRAEVALDNPGRTGNDAARLIGQAWGILADKSDDPSSSRTQINIMGGDLAEKIVQVLLENANYHADDTE